MDPNQCTAENYPNHSQEKLHRRTGGLAEGPPTSCSADHKDQVDKAQEEERLKKEKEETKQKEAEMKANEQEKPVEVSPQDDTEGAQDKSESAHEVIVDASEENHDTAFDTEIDHNIENNASSNSAGGEYEEEDHDESLLEPDTHEVATSVETSPKHTLEHVANKNESLPSILFNVIK